MHLLFVAISIDLLKKNRKSNKNYKANSNISFTIQYFTYDTVVVLAIFFLPVATNNNFRSGVTCINC